MSSQESGNSPVDANISNQVTTENADQKMNEDKSTLSFFQMIGSILASFFGVQNAKNRDRDFKYGKASQFIAVGIFMTLVWYGLIYLIVNVVLANR